MRRFRSVLAVVLTMAAVAPHGHAKAAIASGTVVLGWTPGISGGVAPASSISVYFNRPMSATSLRAAWSLTPAVPGAIRTGTASLTFIPSSGLQPSTRYRITVSSAARSLSGQTLRVFSAGFTTGAALHVSHVAPAGGTTGVPITSAISVTFNHPIVPLSSVDAESTAPRGWSATINPAVAGHGSWLGTSTWVFHPTVSFAPSTRYTVTIGRTVRDASGDMLGRASTWSFRTVGPEIYQRSPHDGDRYVSPSTDLRVTFSQPMSHDVTRTFAMTRAGTPVAGLITWSGATLIFHPSAALLAGATYQVSISHAMKSANGRATLGKTSTWSFRVAPLPHQTWFSPGRGQTAWAQPIYPYVYMAPCCGYGPYRVTIAFNTPMNLSSLNRHLHIEPSVGRFQAFGSWSGRGTYRYMIDGNFDPSKSYTITLDSGVVDQFGRPLQGGVTYPFVTSERFPSVALYGRAGGQNAIAMSAGQVVRAPLQVINIPKVRFTLKHVTLDDLVNTGCGDCDPTGNTVRTWTVTEPIVKDRIQNPDVTIASKTGKPLPAGLYWLKAAPVGSIPGWNPPNSNGPGPTSEVVAVNNVSLTAKSGSNGTLVWATDTRTGKPISGLKVRLADYHGLPLTTSTTDAHGLHLFTNYNNSGRVFAAVVNTGSRFGIAELNWQPDQQSPTYLRWPSWFYGSNYSSNGTYLYTDRAIYRPGQSVNVRGLLWKDSDAVYSLLGKRNATLTVTSSRGKQFVHRTVTLDRFGAAHVSFSLPANLPTGDTQIWLGISHGPSAYTAVTVADYRKPEFVTTVTSARSHYAQGDIASVHVKVTYVFGSPVVHQPVAWTAYATPTEQSPPGWDSYDFVDWETLWNQWSTLNSTAFQNVGPLGNSIAHGKGSTDANGKLTIKVPVNLKKEILDRTVVVEVTATDENSQSVSGRATFGEYHSDLAIGVQTDNSTVATGLPATVNIVAVNQDGAPVPNTTLTATIAKRAYTSVLKTGAGTQPYWQPVPHDTPVSTQTLVSGPDGKATLTFTPPTGGEYFITLAGQDAAGNPTSTSLSIDATSDAAVNWGSDSGTNIVLKPDHSQYTVGQTAHITVPSPFANATALVTVERGGIRRYWTTTISGNVGVVDLPIKLTDIPNEYITVTLYHGWRGTLAPEWRTGTAEIHVKLDPRHVQVRLSQSGGRHHPGDTVTYTVTTTVNGKPVSAELSLALVDTAILALKSETNADILQSLYADRPLGVSTGSQGAISVDNMTARVDTPLAGSSTTRAAPGLGAGGGGGGAFDNTPVYAAAKSAAQAARVPGAKITIRSNFQDTAYWRGNVVTSAAGTATVRVHLPDNTTTWRLDARGLTASQAVGQATARTLATRDLVLRPVLPRFFVQGDHLRVGVVLNNDLAKSVTARVTLSATGLTLHASPVTVTLPAQGEHLILFPATVPVSVAAVLTARAVPSTPGVEGDAVQLPVPVHAPLTDETTATTGQVYSSTRQMVIVPRNAVTSPGALTVNVQSSITAGLGDAYSQLKPREFESNDDVASRLLAASGLHSLPQPITGLTPRHYQLLSTNITAAVQKLLDNQFYDGGWPWFSDGFIIQSDPLVTTDAVQALVASGRHDHLVQQALARATQFLARQVSHTSPGLRARILDVLAESRASRPSLAEKLYNDSIRRLHLDAGSLANLGDALGRAGDMTKARAVVAALEASVKASATGAHWESSDTSFYGGPPIENTIETLQMLLRYAPHDPLVPAAARWLMLARYNSGWDCNRDTGLAIAALAAYARATGEGTADYSYQVEVPNSTALRGRYSRSAQSAVGSAKVPIATLPHGTPVPVDITRSSTDSSYGTGPLYYLARLHYYLPANDIAPLDAGVSISRRFLTLAGKPITSIANGSAMKVELTVHTTQSLYYLEIRDPLPSGCEPIDASLNTAQQGIGPRPSFNPWERVHGVQDLTWYIQHTDLLDNRVDLDVQYLGPGTYRYTYLTQATVAGTYDVPPAHAAEHFFPEVFGRSHGQVLTVR